MMRRNRDSSRDGDGGGFDTPWKLGFGAGDWAYGTGSDGDSRDSDERTDWTQFRYEDSHVAQG